MILCGKCGTENADTDSFCTNAACRAFLGWATQAMPAVDTAPRSGGDDTGGLFVGVETKRAPQQAVVVAVDLWVHPTAVDVEPGNRVDLDFRVHNNGTVVDRVAIAFAGEAAGWAKASPKVLNVYPGDTATGTITLAPPRASSTHAGKMRLDVRARSTEDPSVEATSTVVVKVKPFHEITGRLVPRAVKGRRARHVLTLQNVGNGSVEPAVRVADDDNGLVSSVDPAYVPLQPGRAQNVSVRVRPRKRNWIGSARTFRYSVVGEERDAAPVAFDATLEQRPLLPGWAVRVAAIVLPLLAVVLAFLLLWTRVPDVTGLDEPEATERLEEAGLEPEVLGRHSDRAEEGSVIGTEPGDGGYVRKGSQVKLFVSKGPRPVAIPNVVGLDAATARHELSGLGFAVKDVEQESEKVDEGLVVATRPAPNLMAAPGSTVALVVSTGPSEKGASGKGDDGGGDSEEKEGGGKGGGADDPPAPVPPPDWTKSVASNDFDGDGAADLALFRPGDATWRIRYSSLRRRKVVAWDRHRGSDVPVPGDYDGDGKADFATWRPDDGTWYIRHAGGTEDVIVKLGKRDDIPVPADYDGDGTTDRAVFGAADGKWTIYPSGGDPGAVPDRTWGRLDLGDLPTPGDYDGDGKADLAFYRTTSGHWKITFSGGGSADIPLGNARMQDIPVPADYDGDGRTDIAVWRPGSRRWRVRPSSGGQRMYVTWGRRDLGDTPVPGDYTADGTSDFGLWRESTATWRIRPADPDGKDRATRWGRRGDIPL
ncbi:MAG TPA: PASTA domain-containing protein [Actinomycetota bacterium]|nr:PASTA domain-containing protein [Actinomycetota bacterium]